MTSRDYYRKKHRGIYCIEQISTGKKYVGQSVDCLSRWCDHSSPSKSLISIAFNADRTDFTFRILQVCREQELDALEREWILKMDALHPSGFNKVLPKQKQEPTSVTHQDKGGHEPIVADGSTDDAFQNASGMAKKRRKQKQK